MPNLRVVPINAVDAPAGVVLAASPTLVATMTESNLQLIARDRVARSSSLASQVISGSWGGNLRVVNAWAILRSNLIGAQVRLQLYSDSALTTQVYDSGVIDVYTAGPGWGSFDWGTVPWFIAANDPLAIEAPFIQFIGTTYYPAGFKLTISNAGAMIDSYFELSRLWLGEYLEAPINPEYGLQLGPVSATEKGRTRGGSQRPRRGDRWREMSFRLQLATDADRATWMDLVTRLDLSQPMLMSGFPTIGGRQERDYGFEGTFKTLDASVIENWNQYSQPISIEET